MLEEPIAVYDMIFIVEVGGDRTLYSRAWQWFCQCIGTQDCCPMSRASGRSLDRTGAVASSNHITAAPNQRHAVRQERIKPLVAAPSPSSQHTERACGQQRRRKSPRPERCVLRGLATDPRT